MRKSSESNHSQFSFLLNTQTEEFSFSKIIEPLNVITTHSSSMKLTSLPDLTKEEEQRMKELDAKRKIAHSTVHETSPSKL